MAGKLQNLGHVQLFPAISYRAGDRREVGEASQSVTVGNVAPPGKLWAGRLQRDVTDKLVVGGLAGLNDPLRSYPKQRQPGQLVSLTLKVLRRALYFNFSARQSGGKRPCQGVTFP